MGIRTNRDRRLTPRILILIFVLATLWPAQAQEANLAAPTTLAAFRSRAIPGEQCPPHRSLENSFRHDIAHRTFHDDSTSIRCRAAKGAHYAGARPGRTHATGARRFRFQRKKSWNGEQQIMSIRAMPDAERRPLGLDPFQVQDGVPRSSLAAPG